MKQRFRRLLHSFVFITHPLRHHSSDRASNCATRNAPCSEERLVRSLGFEPKQVERLLHSITTGEEARPSSKKSPQVSCSSLVRECLTRDLFSPLFARERATYLSACGQSFASAFGTTSCVSESGENRYRAFLNRCGKIIERDMRLGDIKLLGVRELELAALALLSRMRLEAALYMYRRGGQCLKCHCASNADEAVHLYTQHHNNIKEHVEVLQLVADAWRSTCSAVKDFQSGNGVSLNSCFLSALSVMASVVTAAEKMRWYVFDFLLKIGGEGEKNALSLLESQVMDAVSCTFEVTHSLVEEVVTGAANGVKCNLKPAELHALLLGIERVLVAVEEMQCAVGSCPSNIYAGQFSMLLMLLQSFSSSSMPSLKLERWWISCLQRLWLKVAPPLERRISDAVMTHRTPHASLNLRYVHSRQKKEEAEKSNLERLLSHPPRAVLLLSLLEHLAATVLLWLKEKSGALSSVAILYAVLSRTLLELETEVYFIASRRSARIWTIPTDPYVDACGTVSGVRKADDKWETVLNAAAAVRVGVSAVVQASMRALVSEQIRVRQTGSNEATTPFVKMPAYTFLKGISTSFFPLMRRHHLDTNGREVLVDCLHTFLLLKQLSDTVDGDGEERRCGATGVPFRICGTSLSQALEVAFFLSLSTCSVVVRNVPSNGCLIDREAVSAYVREVLFALDHNTAKQLSHLRAKKVLKCFTGPQLGSDGNATVDDRLCRRQAQSVLSVVHAHVMHPSFLWMPLMQLQEVVFIFSQNREHLGGLLKAEGVSRTDTGAEVVEPVLVRVGSLGGTRRHFMRALGYLVLRLYVVSNVLRHYRLLLLDGNRYKEDRMPLKDVKVEANKRARRVWARRTAEMIRCHFAGMPAEVEGLDVGDKSHWVLANRRVLSRLDSTIQMALKHGLLFSVKKMRKMRLSSQGMGPSPHKREGCYDVDDTSTLNPKTSSLPSPDGLLTLQIVRSDATSPLGFSVHGKLPIIRRITYTGGRGPKSGLSRSNSPFVAALREVGVTDPLIVMGWTVVSIDGLAVVDGMGIVPLIKGKQSFSMVISAPSD
ncbi:hypothetical protein ERJ75_001828500 [Trypanosoma vivax]|uniref:Uncharacterized protein n=1 Tax=Trypanosoma vivax (strain Y486) TaxID=1055687 RepID=G0U921_TRYVY|nr:hypothetical protein ERJ75_001828500 [Trypanosoma vivax]CCC54104.1 conserved hypothetical protein [Trypanosoma vivax Y486]